MKTPLRYPGGKSRAVKTLMEFIPDDCGELCSPFLGGGSFELALAEKGIKVYGSDIFLPLVWFWQALLADPHKLADECAKFYTGPHQYEYKKVEKLVDSETGEPLTDPKTGKQRTRTYREKLEAKGLLKNDFHILRQELRAAVDNGDRLSFENAARFYAINRSSFSGATFSGGWSMRASHARFTQSSIDRVRNFREPNISVACMDFSKSIPLHSHAFLYLDPPYMLGDLKDKLYGDKGSTHKGFDHIGLYNLLTQRDRWVMSYNDSPVIRELYKDYKIVKAAWTYGMNKTKKSSEIIIVGDKK
tara:strand:+ start:44373 stop:45281 length:909 start_codon:yes stop_codon:yes gene_type:complete